MAEFTKKQKRTIDYALDRLFCPKSFFVPKSIKDFGVTGFVTRQFWLTDDRAICLTDAGLTHMHSIVTAIDEADVFAGLAGYSDIWTACRRILEDLLSKGMRPDNADELLELMRERLSAEISHHTFAVPLFGIDMDGIDVVTLGSMKIVRSPVSHLEVAGVKHDHADLPRTIEATKGYLWILGSAEGTPQVAQQRFREQAELAVGMLAVSAASMYARGASTFRIGVVMSPEEGHGRAIWLSWKDRDPDLATHYNLGSYEQFKLTKPLVEQLVASSVFPRAFKIFESDNRTELEDAITKGIYWFSDAHRDPVPVMQFLKYWSCVETFFSAHKHNTQSVSAGLASMLVYAGNNLVPETEYADFKKRVVKLYGLRSRAVHGAAYHHVSERNVVDLSQWVAWMIIIVIAFAERGYTKLREIKAIADGLDEKFVAESIRR